MNSDKSPSDSNDKRKMETSPSSNFLAASTFLLLDIIFVSIGGWIFWLIISKMTLSSQIGIAVTVYSVITIITTLTQLGIEYPILKRSNIKGTRILGTSLAIALVVTLASIPFMFILMNSLYQELMEFIWISIGLLVLLSVNFVMRFSLLGISNSRVVLVVDLIGLAIKLLAGFFLVYLSFGALGIILAYLLEALFVMITYLFFINRSFSFTLDNLQCFKEIMRDALMNTPAKWSKIIIVSLSVILLASMNVSPSDVGVFYITLMITTVVANFTSSTAYMVIPFSPSLKTDISLSGLRISLALISPLVTFILLLPRSILSLIGSEYESGEIVLFILALSIVPSSITINIISKLNNMKKMGMLIMSGALQMVAFFISFFVLVPIYGITGAAISVLFAYLTSSIMLLILTDKESFKYVIFACLSISAGFIAGYSMETIIAYEQQLLVTVTSIAVSVLVIFVSKLISIRETKFLVKSLIWR